MDSTSTREGSTGECSTASNSPRIMEAQMTSISTDKTQAIDPSLQQSSLKDDVEYAQSLPDGNSTTTDNNTNTNQESLRSQSIRRSVQRMKGNEAPYGSYLCREQLSVRKRFMWGYMTQWSGTVTGQTWAKVVAYGIYLTAIALLFHLGCDEYDSDNLQQQDTIFPERCNYANGDSTTSQYQYDSIVYLWVVFTGFAFFGLVQAGLERFRTTLRAIRSIQGSLQEVSMYLHTYCSDQSPLTKNEPMEAANRLLIALPFFLYSHPHFKLHNTEEFLTQAGQYLEPDEMLRIANITSSLDRPYAMMMWIPKLVLDSVTQQQQQQENRPFLDPHATLTMPLVRAMEQLRRTYSQLLESLEDPIVPFPFASLMMSNIYLGFVMLPFTWVISMGYGMIPAGLVCFWFLDGILTFVLVLLDEPFCTQKRGDSTYPKKTEPLIDLRRAIDESVLSLPHRFPNALKQHVAAKLHVE